MSVLQTNAFPLGYSAVTGNSGKFEAMANIAGAETTARKADLSISNGGNFQMQGEPSVSAAMGWYWEKWHFIKH